MLPGYAVGCILCPVTQGARHPKQHLRTVAMHQKLHVTLVAAFCWAF